MKKVNHTNNFLPGWQIGNCSVNKLTIYSNECFLFQAKSREWVSAAWSVSSKSLPSQFASSHCACLKSVNCWQGAKAGCGWHMRYPRVFLTHVSTNVWSQQCYTQGHLQRIHKTESWPQTHKKPGSFYSFPARGLNFSCRDHVREIG